MSESRKDRNGTRRVPCFPGCQKRHPGHPAHDFAPGPCHPERRKLGAPCSGVSGAKDLLLLSYCDRYNSSVLLQLGPSDYHDAHAQRDGAEISKSVITTERNEMELSTVVVVNKSLRHRKKEYVDPDVKIDSGAKENHSASWCPGSQKRDPGHPAIPRREFRLRKGDQPAILTRRAFYRTDDPNGTGRTR
jgi:hypothetical protein